MAKILVVLAVLPLLAIADEVYDEFLRLKQKGVDERVAFYHSISNNMAELMNGWNEEKELFTISRNDGSMSNVVYDVDLICVSTNVISTNLTQVSQHFLNGEVNRYTYDKQGNVEMIEIEGRNLGDLNIYQIDADGELDAYIATTNFIGIHGVRQYRNGNIIRVGPIPNLEIFRP